MPRLEKEILVRRPRREVYDFLLDVQTRQLYFPDEFRGFHVTSSSARGVGATAAFEVELGKVHPGECVISGVLPPEGVTEIDRLGPVRSTTRYALEEQDGGTRVRIIMEYVVQGILHKLLDPVLYAPAMHRWHGRILERLKDAVERQTAEEVAARVFQQVG
jgi:carbon monoxide dehydrogenase subunit G